MTNSIAEDTEWLTVFEASTRLGRSEKSVRRLIKNGAVHAVKVRGSGGQEWRIEPGSVERHRAHVNAGRAAGKTSIAAGGLPDAPQSDGGSSSELAFQSSESAAEGRVEPAGGSPENDSRLSRLEGYVARDLETIVGRAVAEAVTAAQAPLLKRIEELTTVQAAQVAENAALRREVELMAATQMAAHLAALSPESAAEEETTQDATQTPEMPVDVLHKPMMLDLQQAQELSDEIDLLQAENERLKFELEKTRRSWWQRFFLDP
jgi:uncharacterized small protein (DUF1192 family)